MFETSQQSPQEIPFEFKGTASQYFGIWIVNLLLTIITLGIYTPWAKVRTKRYFYGNTLLAGSPFDYLASPIAILKGWAVAIVVLIVYNVLTNVFPVTSLLLLPLLLIALPWVIVRAMRFRARNSAWRNIRFGFKKAYGEAIKVFIGLPILMVLTLGLLLPYYYFAMSRFMVANSGYGTSAFRFHASPRDFYKIFMKPVLAMLVVMIALVAVSYPKLKEYYEHYQAALESAQIMQGDTDEYMDEEAQEDTYAENSEGLQDEMMADQNASINPEQIHEEQHAAMLDQAMQDLAKADAELENVDEVLVNENESADLYANSDMGQYAGSGDEEYDAVVTVDQADLANQGNPDAESDVSDIIKYAAIGGGMLIMLIMFLFYLVFMAYFQSRTWNLLYNSTELAGHRFRSSVRARDIIWLYATNMLVISLTFGLMIPWARIRMARYRASKLTFLPAGNLDSFMQAQQEKISALGEEMGDVFDLDIGI